MPVLSPAIVKRPARNSIPTTRNVANATTLIRTAQNSISPNSFTEIMFTVRTITSAISANVHCGTAWNAPRPIGGPARR
jgi:hypothetical protein